MKPKSGDAHALPAAFTTSYTDPMEPKSSDAWNLSTASTTSYRVAVIVTNFGPDGAEVRRCLDVVNGFHYVAHGGRNW